MTRPGFGGTVENAVGKLLKLAVSGASAVSSPSKFEDAALAHADAINLNFAAFRDSVRNDAALLPVASLRMPRSPHWPFRTIFADTRCDVPRERRVDPAGADPDRIAKLSTLLSRGGRLVMHSDCWEPEESNDEVPTVEARYRQFAQLDLQRVSLPSFQDYPWLFPCARAPRERAA